VARILVADDEDSLREILARGLDAAGHEVVAVEDGVEALHELKRGRFDLLLTDIVMPRLDGIALALKVGRDYPALEIILMTGYADQEQRAHNLEALVHEIVTKPFTLDEIRAVVARRIEAR
jgi:two-component system, cell cycle response regulator CpdR